MLIKRTGSTSTAVDVAGPLFRLGGKSQPWLVKGADGHLYVLKFYLPARGQRLMGEVLGTELFRSFGLPVPPWTYLHLSEAFLDRHSEVRLQMGGRSIRPPAGLHFGSRLMLSGDGKPGYQVIPTAWIPRVENRIDFIGALILDLWINNCDRRQAVFLRGSSVKKLSACFVDFDHAFGGSSGTEITCPRRAMVPNLAFYSGLWADDSVSQWLQKVKSTSGSEIDSFLQQVSPCGASKEDLSRARSLLLRRQNTLNALVNEASSVLRSSYSIRDYKPRNATRPGFLCTFGAP